MPVTKRIVCLANSRKLCGRCIAGAELAGSEPTRRWLRPVSAREHQEVSEYERQYKDGSDPGLLDIIDIPLLGAQPRNYQRENWLLNPKHYWQKVGTLPWSDLYDIAESTGTLWQNDCHTNNGQNDRIPLPQACSENHSLKLIHVDSMKLRVFAPSAAFGNGERRVQARFCFSGIDYALWVTDPRIERACLAKTDGDYPFGERFLTVSLGDPFNARCHKLVAAVIQRLP